MSGPGAGLPLRPGDTGDGVRDLQERLAACGFAPTADPLGTYGIDTEEALRRFRIARRLPPADGCDRSTWEALVEAGFHLGDRLLFLAEPELRGDDVAALQHDLGALGFDAGKVDGIFDERTHAALADFQRNAGLVVDAICGPVTVAALARLRRRAADAPVAHLLREQETWHGLGSLRGRRVVVAEGGGLAVVVDELRRHLTDLGAHALPIHHPDGEARAKEANSLDADVYVGLDTAPGAVGCATAYFASPRTSYVSRAGRELAQILGCRVAEALGIAAAGSEGMSLPELRETRMTAVLCRVGPPALVAERATILAEAVGASLGAWTTIDEGSTPAGA